MVYPKDESKFNPYRPDRSFLTDDDVDKIISYQKDPAIKALICILYLYGCRISEALLLTKKSFWQAEDFLWVLMPTKKKGRKHKNKKPVVEEQRKLNVDIGSHFTDIIIDYIKDLSSDEKLFNFNRVQAYYKVCLPFGRKTEEQRIRAYEEVNVWLHYFRDSCLTQLALNGATPFQIRDWAGWSSLAPTESYIRLSGLHTKEAGKLRLKRGWIEKKETEENNNEILINNFTFEEVKKLTKGLCGIYFLYDENNKLLYIGKSNNLKERLSQHFRASESYNYHINIQRQVPYQDVDIFSNYSVIDMIFDKVKKCKLILHITATQIDLKIEELKLIQELKPCYNSEIHADDYYKIQNEWRPYTDKANEEALRQWTLEQIRKEKHKEEPSGKNNTTSLNISPTNTVVVDKHDDTIERTVAMSALRPQVVSISTKPKGLPTM